jgi:uncharacterized protein YqgQ
MIKKLLLIFSFIILATIAFNGTTYAIQTGEIIVITEELYKLNKLYKEGFITEEEFSSAKSILLNPDSGTTKEELSTLNKLYKEGFITEEEFSKAKSILLNPDSGTTKKEEKKWWQWPDEEMEEKRKAVILKKQKLTAVERRDLEELEKEELKAKKHVEKKKKLTAVERRNLEKLEKEELKAAKEAEKESKRERKSEERKRQAEEKELARQTCKDNPEVKCPSTVLGTLKKLNIFKKN